MNMFTRDNKEEGKRNSTPLIVGFAAIIGLQSLCSNSGSKPVEKIANDFGFIRDGKVLEGKGSFEATVTSVMPATGGYRVELISEWGGKMYLIDYKQNAPLLERKQVTVTYDIADTFHVSVEQKK